MTIFEEALNIAQAAGFKAPNATLRRVFTDGLSHDTALFAAGEQQFVVKVFRGNEQLVLRAIRAQCIAAELGLAPTVLYSSEPAKCLISAFIDAPALSHVLARQAPLASQLDSIARALATLHRLKPSPAATALGHFDIVQFCAGYVQSLDDAVQQQHALLSPTLRAFQERHPQVLCHNDLVAANIFCVTTEHAQFIDWEYAQLNNPWFDLAAVVFYLQLNERATELFLRQYASAQGNTGADRLEGSLRADNSFSTARALLLEATTALLWGDILWHLHTLGNAVRPQLAYKLAWLEQHAQAFQA